MGYSLTALLVSMVLTSLGMETLSRVPNQYHRSLECQAPTAGHGMEDRGHHILTGDTGHIVDAVGLRLRHHPSSVDAGGADQHIRYVTQQRLDRARHLTLESGDLTGVAERAGFCDDTAFFRAFRQEYGLSPSEYRKIHS